MKLSQSVLSASEDCMLKAQYTLDRPSWAKRVGGSQRATGTGYHAGLEIRYMARRDGLPLPTLDDMVAAGINAFRQSMTVDLYDNTPLDAFKWDEKVPDQETAERFISEMLSTYMDGGHEWPDDWNVLAVEHHAHLPVPELGVELKFGADMVLLAPDNGVVVVDNKTAGKKWDAGKSNPRKNVQAPVYVHLARRIWPDAPYYRFVFDVMTLPAKNGSSFERIICDPQLRHEAAILNRAKAFKQVYQAIHVAMGADLPPNPGSTLCNPKWCDWFDGCPYGAALEGAT